MPETDLDKNDPDPMGWNLIGMIEHRGGIGNAARANFQALRMLLERSRAISFPSARYAHPKELPAIHGRNYLHFNPCSRAISDLAAQPWFKDKINVGYWAWETTRSPDKWLGYDPHMAQIWVPSRFVKTALKDSGFRAPVFVIPHAIAPQAQHDYPKDGRPIRFLVQFDGHSLIERKRPDLSIKAILQAAAEAREKIHLTIKCHHDDASHLVLEDYPGITYEVINWWLEPGQMEQIWKNIDVFVSLNRGEGFGLPIMEAMARGIAAVATGWGGVEDFMNPVNSYPVDYDLEHTTKSGSKYFKTGEWAMPDVEHAVHQIRQAMRAIRSGEISQTAGLARGMANLFAFDKMLAAMKNALSYLP